MDRNTHNSQNGSGNRPILHHLNVDSSWLLQIPRREIRSGDGEGQRKYFNILIDPWLAGSQTDIGIWLSKQWFREESRYPDIPSVEALIRSTEGPSAGQSPPREGESSKSLVDAVFVCHEFTDHCHHDTLVQLPPSVPIFANPNPAKLIKSWHHFYNVHVVEPLGDQPPTKVSDGKADEHGSLQTPHLPPGFDIRFVSGGYNGRNIGFAFHVALVIAFPVQSEEDNAKIEQELVVYTPHGVPPTSLTPILTLEPQPRTLCLLHGKNEFWLAGAPVNLGARNALDVVAALKPAYWIGTHEPIKDGVGIVQTFLRRTEIDIEEVKKERRDSRMTSSSPDGEMQSATFQEIPNGQSIELV